MSVGGMCKDCISGTLHDGTPTGKIETWFGVETYVAQPEGTPKAIIVIIADAFGWELTNNRILADNYANKGGYLTLLPDFFRGKALNPEAMGAMYEAMASSNPLLKRLRNGLWALSHVPSFFYYNRFSVRGPEVYAWFYALRHSAAAGAQPGSGSSGTRLKIGAAGFCWGGKLTFYLAAPSSAPDSPTHAWFTAAKRSPAAPDEYLIDAGYTAHPSALDLPADAAAVVQPVSVANGSKDIQVTPAKAPMIVEAFAAKNRALGLQGDGDDGLKGLRYVYVNYEGAGHGFAVRNNPYNEGEKEMGERAEAQALDFFAEWLA